MDVAGRRLLLLTTLPVLLVSLIVLVLGNLWSDPPTSSALRYSPPVFVHVPLLARFLKVPETKGMPLEVITEFFAVGAKQSAKE
ncbi:transporter [Datura stramonium]|uniref:Transporter n=1 Tax=Datura stramonium TaxID=4076 RepID=A0ABS8RPF4_DATST|nr:transporter [Datura stramonium]